MNHEQRYSSAGETQQSKYYPATLRSVGMEGFDVIVRTAFMPKTMQKLLL
jgi:hypothetical protein